MKIKNMRWFIMLVAFLGICICYMDRAALSYAITPIEHEFALNNSQFGLLLSFFGMGYLLMMPVGGLLADHFGAHRVWSGAAIIWSIATIFTGFASGFIIILILRLLVGLAEGPSFPAVTKVAASWFPMRERGKALALVLAAVPFSSVIGAPLSTYLIARFNWQFMFIFLGVVGLFWAIIWLCLYRDKPQSNQLVTKEELDYLSVENANDQQILQHHLHTNYRFILFNKTFLINNYAFFAFGYLLFFAISWLPGYLEQSYHLPIKKVGMFLVLPWILSTFTLMGSGVLADWLWHKTHSLKISRSMIIGVSMLASALCFIPAIMCHDIYISLIFISLAIAIGLLPNSCFYALNADLALDKVATSLGIMDAFLALAGILAPFITGYLSNLAGNFKSALAVMLFLNVSSAILVLFFQNPDKELQNKRMLS